MRPNRPAPRVDQLGFRLVVHVVWLAVAVYMLVRPARAYQPMWRLGDWPSRYRVAAE